MCDGMRAGIEASMPLLALFRAGVIAIARPQL